MDTLILVAKNITFCWVSMLLELSVSITMKSSKSFSSDFIRIICILN